MKIFGSFPRTKAEKRRLIVHIIEDVIIVAVAVLVLAIFSAIAEWAFRLLGVA